MNISSEAVKDTVIGPVKVEDFDDSSGDIDDDDNWDEDEMEEKDNNQGQDALKFKESRWGSMDEPQGYTYKSRSKKFDGALKNIKIVMRKGTEKAINDIQFKVLDSVIKNGSKEVLLEIKHSKEGKGKVSVKLFGPNKKKWSTIMVNKHKESDATFVKIGASDIVKPLLEGFLKGKSSQSMLDPKSAKIDSKVQLEFPKVIDSKVNLEFPKVFSAQNKNIEQEILPAPMEIDSPEDLFNNKPGEYYEQDQIKKIPRSCRQFLQKGDVQFIIPGNGSCAPNCAAQHLFKDFTEGPKLRQEMNDYIVQHKEYYKNKGYWCSEENPFERECPKMKKGKVHFINPEDLYKFLKYSKEGAYMWSDSEDLHVIANMYQMPIKVITFFTEKGRPPTENIIGLDPELAPFAKIKEKVAPPMTILHYDNCHFNLVVNYRKTAAKENDKEDEESQWEDIENENNDHKKIIEMEKKLKTSECSKKELENSNKILEDLLISKTEEIEKLNIIVKDLKQLMSFKENEKELEENSWTFRPESKDLSSLTTNGPGINDEITKEEWNCVECFFQGSSNIELIKHTNLKHKKTDEQIPGTLKCNDCNEQFSSKWSLMNHRKEHHPSENTCKYFLQSSCKFTADICWFKHDVTKNNSQINSQLVACYVCKETFKNKNEMMKHRRVSHTGVVRTCTNFKTNSCRFNSENCWFLHKDESLCVYGSLCKNFRENKCSLKHLENSENKNREEGNKNNKSDLVFQKGPIDPKPPIFQKMEQ